MSDSADSLNAWFDRLSCASLAMAAAELIAAPESSGRVSGSTQSADASTTGTPTAAAQVAAHASVDNSVDTMLLTISRQAMACEWEVLLNQHQYPAGAEHAMQALDLVEQLEGLFSVYRAHSDLSAINRFAGTRPVAVAVDSLRLLQLARDLNDLTNGAFDLTAGSLSQVWGFSRRAGRMPNEREIEKALELVGGSLIEFNETERLVTLTKPGVVLNSGGIGKGYALDRAGRKLISAGVTHFMMHGGMSSIVAQGDRQHRETGGGWLVALKHPWRWEETLGMIRLRNQALGTSGSGKQFFHYQGERYSHIINPRSGWPAQGMMSTTVICPSAAVADALATAMFVMGREESRAFCHRHPQVGAILVYADPRSGTARVESHNLTPDQWQPLS